MRNRLLRSSSTLRSQSGQSTGLEAMQSGAFAECCYGYPGTDLGERVRRKALKKRAAYDSILVLKPVDKHFSRPLRPFMSPLGLLLYLSTAQRGCRTVTIAITYLPLPASLLTSHDRELLRSRLQPVVAFAAG